MVFDFRIGFDRSWSVCLPDSLERANAMNTTKAFEEGYNAKSAYENPYWKEYPVRAKTPEEEVLARVWVDGFVFRIIQGTNNGGSNSVSVHLSYQHYLKNRGSTPESRTFSGSVSQ